MLIDFLSGAVTMGFVIAGLFFLRFWKRTRERLFIPSPSPSGCSV
jgi:hypothetical protein